MTRLLLLNTCAAEAVVALSEGSAVVAVEQLPGRGTAEYLMPSIERVLASRQVALRSLDAIAVVAGPGSFTGVRVGLSAAKGLCEAGSVRMIAISRLELLASLSAQALADTEILALLDAGRSEYYCGAYRRGIRIAEDLLSVAEVRERLAPAHGVACEDLVIAALGASVEQVAEPGADAMLQLALRKIADGEWSDVATLDANYLRRTDAELLKLRNEGKAV